MYQVDGSEVLFYKTYSTSSDVWSYWMLMYEIWSLRHEPFGDSQPNQVAIGGDVHVDVCIHARTPPTIGGVCIIPAHVFC